MYRVTLLLLFCFISNTIYSQTSDTYCGTVFTDEMKARLNAYAEKPKLQRSSNTIYHIPLSVHIVGSSSGSNYFQFDRLLDRICKLNEDFAPTGFVFYLKHLRYIKNTNWNTSWDDHQDMMAQKNIPNTINSYITEHPGSASYAVCGYYTGSGDAVVIKKTCLGTSSSTWAHELGHFFGLPHTFLGWEGTDYLPGMTTLPDSERADGSNCQTAGDRFCDTRADYLSNRWNCANNSESGVELTDPVGAKFRADGTNFMSYANDECHSIFSDEQQNYMIDNLLNDRTGLATNNYTPQDSITTSPILSTPAQNEEVPFNAVQLSWEPVPNATKYHVIVSFVPTYAVYVEDEIVTSTSFVSYKLDSNRNYYWQIKAYNNDHTCTVYTRGRFRTNGTTVSLQTPVDLSNNKVSFYPNPVEAKHINIETELMKTQSGTLSIYNVVGQLQQSQIVNFDQGINSQPISIANLEGGVYIFDINLDNGERFYSKIIVQ